MAIAAKPSAAGINAANCCAACDSGFCARCARMIGSVPASDSGRVSNGLPSWLWLVAGTAVLLVIGHLGAWWLGRAVGLDRANRVSMLFAGGQKSIAMGAPMATVLFPPAVAGVILLPILLYHLVQLIIAAPIAVRLRGG